jgi:hypothetical protein
MHMQSVLGIVHADLLKRGVLASTPPLLGLGAVTVAADAGTLLVALLLFNAALVALLQQTLP